MSFEKRLDEALGIQPQAMLRVSLTDDTNLDPLANIQILGKPEIIRYLDANPRNAVVVHKGPQRSYVMRAADDISYYSGPWPAEDPGDADGPFDSSAEALESALSYQGLTSGS